MKFCAIAPINKIKDTKENAIHMALAHLCDNAAYVKFFVQEKEDNKKFIILDNSIVELGEAVTPEFLLQQAEKIHADEVVLPDYFKDSKKTIESAKDNVYFFHKRGYRVMGVAQGKDLTDWLNCAKELVKLGVDTLGVPKIMTKILGNLGRATCLRELLLWSIKEQVHLPSIHLLGIWNDPLEVGYIYNQILEGDLPPVRSCDSAISYVYANQNLLFENVLQRPSVKIDFNHGVCHDDTHLRNIIQCRQMCGDNMRLEFEYTQDVSYPKDYAPNMQQYDRKAQLRIIK